jgi:hypothetical protein
MATKQATTEAPKPTVIYSINGKARIVRTSPRPYTFSYLAGEVVGGKGASQRLRDELAKLGVTDPEHTEWSVTLANGKAVAASFDVPTGATPAKAAKAAKAPAKAPAKAAKSTKTAKAAKSTSKASEAPQKAVKATKGLKGTTPTGRRPRTRRSPEAVKAMRAEDKALKAWKAGGESGAKPATPTLDAENERLAENEAGRQEARKAERTARADAKRQPVDMERQADGSYAVPGTSIEPHKAAAAAQRAEGDATIKAATARGATKAS